MLYEDDNFKEFKETLEKEASDINQVQSEQRELSMEITQALAEIQQWRENRKKKEKQYQEQLQKQNQQERKEVKEPENEKELQALTKKANNLRSESESTISSLRKNLQESSQRINDLTQNSKVPTEPMKVPSVDSNALQEEIENLKAQDTNYEEIMDQKIKVQQDYKSLLDQLTQIETGESDK